MNNDPAPTPQWQDWQGWTALDWWTKAVQHMHHESAPMHLTLRFANADLRIRIEIDTVLPRGESSHPVTPHTTH